MALTHLVDTSVILRLNRDPVRRALAPLMEEGQIARATVTDLEVGYGARNLGEWDESQVALSAFASIETTTAHVRRSLQVQRLLAARSQRGGKIPDLLVAAAAEGRGLTVLHYEGDFELIAGVTGQPCRWVVPAGSVD